MIDEILRLIERKARAGDADARARLTAKAIESQKGFLILWYAEHSLDPGELRERPEGSMLIKITRLERNNKVKAWRSWAVAVLDLADAFELIFRLRTRSAENVDMLELETGRCLSGAYARQAKVTDLELVET